MRNSYRGVLAFLVLWILGSGTLPSSAAAPEVRDDAGLFSAAVVRQADESIRRIQKQFHKDLLVETFAGIPEGRSEEYSRNREEFFSSLVRDRARSAQLDGIYVLVMKEPPPHRFRIQVGVGQATRQRAFSLSNRDELVRIFQTAFRQDHYDEALLNGVAYVERTLRDNLQANVASQSTVPSSSGRSAPVAHQTSSRDSIAFFLFLGVIILGGVMVVGFLMRLFRGSMGGGLAGSGGLGGGGGFLTSLLGGIGGAMAGSWLYDRFLSGNAHAADSFTSNQSDIPPSDLGGDFSSSGADVDMSSGGSDFSSGGDFGGGGGDFGGGGDA